MVYSDEYGPFEEHTIGGNKYCFVCWWVWSKVVSGPFEEHTIGGNKYCFVCWWVFEGNVSMWSKRKDGVFDIFKRFEMLFEN